MWIWLVEMNVWIRQSSAPFSASAARRMSPSVVRASAAITGPRTLDAISATASNSPSDETGNPASRMSTFSRASCSAISTFSARVSAMPGACSPSRRVVSKIRTLLPSPTLPSFMSGTTFVSLSNQGIIWRSPRPTSSSWDVRAWSRSRRKVVNPPSASAIHSLANVPSWISSRIRRISARTSVLMTRGPRV